MRDVHNLSNFEHCILSKVEPHIAEDWCGKNLGPRWSIFNTQGTWAIFWAGSLNPECHCYYFANKKDATLFCLKFPQN